MLKAFRQLQESVQKSSWKDLNHLPLVNVYIHESKVCAGQVKLVYWLSEELEPDYYDTRLYRAAIKCLQHSRKQCVLHLSGIKDRTCYELVVGVISNPKASSECFVQVRVESWCDLPSKKWTLEVPPKSGFIPIFQGVSFLPRGPTTSLKLKTVSGQTQYPPSVIRAVVSEDARIKLLTSFGIGKLYPEMLPDLRYQGPLKFGKMIEKELVEELWHPRRVARNMKMIDES